MRFFFDIFFSFLMNNIIILYIIGSSMLRDEDFLIYIQNSPVALLMSCVFFLFFCGISIKTNIKAIASIDKA